jgi:hypothetical protein
MAHMRKLIGMKRDAVAAVAVVQLEIVCEKVVVAAAAAVVVVVAAAAAAAVELFVNKLGL